MLPKAPLMAGASNDVSPSVSFNPIPAPLQQGITNILFYEDFANGFAGNNGIGAWTAEDTGGGLIWQAVNSEGEGVLRQWGSIRGCTLRQGSFRPISVH